MFVVHPSEDFLGSQKVTFRELSFLAIDGNVVVILDELGVYPCRQGFRNSVPIGGQMSWWSGVVSTWTALL